MGRATEWTIGRARESTAPPPPFPPFPPPGRVLTSLFPPFTFKGKGRRGAARAEVDGKEADEGREEDEEKEEGGRKGGTGRGAVRLNGGGSMLRVL